MKNTLKGAMLLVYYRGDYDAMIGTCTTGLRLGEKKLSHTALIVNHMHESEQSPTMEQMGKVAQIICWLSIS